MLAKETSLAHAAALVLDDEWVFEQKLDGHRVLVLVMDNQLVTTNRNGQPYTKGFPLEAANLVTEHFRPGDHVDGELVGGTFWAFDILHSGPRDTTKMEHVERRSHLKAHRYPYTLPQARTSEAKARLMRRVRDEGGEGIVAKHLYSPYQPGARSPKMLKAKYVKTIDCIVVELDRKGKDAIGLGVVGPDGLVEIGACSMIGKGKVEVGDVVMVRYLYANNPAAPRLYQPTLLEKRDDKAPAECTIDQVVYTDKSLVVLP
jgi:bifunctional non-homologous end joining protein LigD